MTKLQELYSQQGQSPWIDNLTRNAIEGGGLRSRVDEGIRGVTSNPTIFQKAMTGSDAYDEQFAGLLDRGSVEAAFWDMAIDDVTHACGVLRPVYDVSDRSDGFVSIEVSPALASDTDGTIEAARSLHERISLPNLMVKIPATAEGIPAIRKMTSEGRNINITLIFSLSRYEEVIEAYLSGLEEFVSTGGDPSQVHSVASFFVSRVDTEVDRRLEDIGEPGADLAGKAAVAQAKLAYQLFRKHFSGERWANLEAKGAHLQRPLWASTSTKNPAYPDLLYVDNLIGPHTVNTLPDKTIEAFEDHGTVKCTVDSGVDEASNTLDRLAKCGVDLVDVARVLEEEGVSAFVKSYDELLQALEDKANGMATGSASKH